MARRSSIVMDLRVKEAVDGAIRANRTIDEILEVLQPLGADISRSAVGRYAKRARETMEKWREAQEVRKIWVDQFGKDPEGDIGTLLMQMLQSVAYGQLSAMGDQPADLTGKDGVSPRHVALLAQAIKDLSSAQKTTADRILKVRQETASKAAEKAVEVAKSGGMSKDVVEQLRAAIIGTAA